MTGAAGRADPACDESAHRTSGEDRSSGSAMRSCIVSGFAAFSWSTFAQTCESAGNSYAEPRPPFSNQRLRPMVTFPSCATSKLLAGMFARFMVGKAFLFARIAGRQAGSQGRFCGCVRLAPPRSAPCMPSTAPLGAPVGGVRAKEVAAFT